MHYLLISVQPSEDQSTGSVWSWGRVILYVVNLKSTRKQINIKGFKIYEIVLQFPLPHRMWRCTPHLMRTLLPVTILVLAWIPPGRRSVTCAPIWSTALSLEHENVGFPEGSNNDHLRTKYDADVYERSGNPTLSKRAIISYVYLPYLFLFALSAFRPFCRSRTEEHRPVIGPFSEKNNSEHDRHFGPAEPKLQVENPLHRENGNRRQSEEWFITWLPRCNHFLPAKDEKKRWLEAETTARIAGNFPQEVRSRLIHSSIVSVHRSSIDSSEDQLIPRYCASSL